MIGVLITVLIICALIAAIWGKQAGQDAFGCIAAAIITAVAIGVLGFLWFIDWVGSSSPSNTSTSSSTASTNVAPASSQSPAAPSNPTTPSSQDNPAPTTGQATMPNLCGMTIENARSVLASDNLVVEHVTVESTENPVRPRGEVIEQNPPANSPVSSSTQVRLAIASGRGFN